MGALDEEIRALERADPARAARMKLCASTHELTSITCIFCGHGLTGLRCEAMIANAFYPCQCNCDHSGHTMEHVAVSREAVAAEREKYEQRHGCDLRVMRSLHPGATLYHVTERNADFSPLRARINGMIKTWKRNPQRFRVPMKHGLKTCFYIDVSNCREWRSEEEWAKRSQ